MTMEQPCPPPNEPNHEVELETADTPSPLKALHRLCLECCAGSAFEVTQCPAKSCPLWAFRAGRNPTPKMIAELGERLVYPLEDERAAADFHGSSTGLKAIKRYCLDCSGNSRSEVRACRNFGCPLHPFRLGKNPNRQMNSGQRAVAVARLKANIEGARRRKLG
jgi:hypothetical protein